MKITFLFSQRNYISLRKLFLIGIFILCQLGAMAQQRKIMGNVTDDFNDPLPGASVIVQGTTIGAITDLEGNFTLDIPNDAKIIEVSFIGMVTQKIEVGDQTNFQVQLLQDIVGMDEVVVVGYGTQKKSDLTGSIVSVKADDLKERPGAGMIEKMQGKAAGVDITKSTGQPGSEPTVRIRGRRSFSATNDPLYVVDGIPLQDGINDINPNDIISIEVLKDAASAAIYGSRGANGVILVTTKKGESTGETHISYSGYYGVTDVSRMVDLFNGEEFAEYRREAYRAADAYTSDAAIFSASELENLANGVWYNYPELIFDKGAKMDHQLGVSGGNQKTQFAISTGYFDEQGVIENLHFNRYSVRVNLDHKITDYIKVGTATTMSHSLQQRGGSDFDSHSNDAIESALKNSPLGACYDEDGGLNFYPTTDGLLDNPIFDTKSENIQDETKTNRVFSSLYADVTFLKYFNYRLNAGIDSRYRRRGRFAGTYSLSQLGGNSSALVSQNDYFTYTLENILKFNRDFNQIHKVDVTFMQSIQKMRYENYYSEVSDLPYETQKFYNMDSAGTVEDIASQLTEWQLASFMGRLNYDYDGRYLIQATLRADGSSRLSPGKKWGYFPSAAFGWRIINEPFMQNIDWVQNLKLRTSYGVVGNSAISPYQTQGALERSSYAYGSTSAYGYILTDIPNPDLRWESTATVDAGLDFGFFNGKLSGSVDIYRANTTDLLMERQVPASSGYTSVIENIGATRNQGIEINLNTVLIESKRDEGFGWTLDVNWFKNKEEIVELYGGTDDDIGNSWFIGEPITAFYDYEKIGIWQTDEADVASSYGFNPGEIKLKDQNNDGVIDATNDRVILGSDVPKWTLGVTTRMDYKNFDFSCFVYTRYGSTIYSYFHYTYNSLFGRYNNIDVDYWTEDNPTNAYPRPNVNQEVPRYASSMAYFNGTFVKVRNITLGYTLPKQFTKKIGVDNLRVYATADQPFMFTKYEGYDPEDDTGYVNTSVPSNRAIIFGVNVNF